MNKTKIEWTDYTWNPITGCLNNCHYCYARRIYRRFHESFIPKFHHTRLIEPSTIKKPSVIFVCSVADFWGEGVQQIWRDEVYKAIRQSPWHTFMILTKQPQNINDGESIPWNVWVGISASSSNDWHRAMKLISKDLNNDLFISIEPILDNIFTPYFLLFDWIILGGLTPKPAHKSEWIKRFLRLKGQLKIPVFMKNNLKPIWKGKLLREFPGMGGS